MSSSLLGGFHNVSADVSNKDEDNSPKTLSDKNHQASSQKFKQLVFFKNIFEPFYGI